MQLNSTYSIERKRGFTVVELMIAVAIAAILMLGVIQTFVMSKHTYKLSDSLARAQENARYAVSYLSREIRMAGYVGCRGTNVANVLNYTPGDWTLDFSDAIEGWEGDATSSTFPSQFKANAIPGTDAFVIHRAAGTEYKITKGITNPSTNMFLNTTAGLTKFDIVVATDCSQTSIFQLTGVNNSGLNVQHETGNGTPGNCTSGLGSPVVCTNSNPTIHNFGVDTSSLLKMTATAYYIGQSTSGNGQHALFSLSMDQGAVGTPQELAEGIEDMQVLYGVDTSGDGLANKYIAADQVPGSTPTGWKAVVSVRLGLLIDTVENNVIKTKDNTDYTIAGTTITHASPGTGVHEHPEDYRLRFPITTTIKLRNRGTM